MKPINVNYNKKSAYLLGIAIPVFIILILLLVIWKTQPSTFDRLRELVINPGSNEREIIVLSDIYEIDRIYKSMKGPNSMQKLILSKTDEPELLWITSFKAVMVGPDGSTPMSQEFMCHSNLDFNNQSWWVQTEAHHNNKGIEGIVRLFTLSQGQYEIEFPKGFGIPIYSTEKLSLTTQVLNLNDTKNKFQVRHKVTLNYVRDRDLKTPMKPLVPVAVYGLKLLEGDEGYFGVEHANEEIHGSSCLVGENASPHLYSDKFRRKFTGHWVVKPGREVNHTLATKLMNVLFDTTIHYIAVHLHPFAESLELRDLTTGETVFKSRVRKAKDKIGIEEVEYFSSEGGIPIYKDHEYQIISIYNNTSDEDVDSMAAMYLYLLYKEFKKTGIALKQQS